MLNVNTTLGALLLAGVTALSGAAQAQDLPPLPAAIKEAGKIRIGVKCDSPPFGASGPDGKPLGIEIEMARKIGTFAFGSEAGQSFPASLRGADPSLNSGKLDLILATLAGPRRGWT
ncbi:hypothetical protein [Rhodobacter capsulatus]|uniref:hypothetical protein n=1 Tax=Rhodobacter capsulatus TaxID=1061 RepID=UPI00402549FE